MGAVIAGQGQRRFSTARVKSCKACDVNPWKYFDDMLRRIMSHPVHRLRELLPGQWEPLTTQA
ncbi:MAG: transposase domain-containing protein [Deltaproteobacteria bacterium]|nr:transposase domain-containing protein [Deltaproteobacteria bacterium]MBW2348321.1 transposase domain-containing protein [Deltaproteobacteria bacterium]